jgi:hypothetical protein
MAVGADYRLPKSQASVLKPPAPGPQKVTTPSYGYQPPMISDRSVQGAVNNQLEAGAGAKRLAMTQLDATRGVSRGKGIDYASDIAQSDADTQAKGAAAATEMGVARSNAAARLQYENTMRGEQLGNAGLLEGLRNTASMEGMHGRNLRETMRQAMRNGQFGLDQQQLDYSSLLNGLFG